MKYEKKILKLADQLAVDPEEALAIALKAYPNHNNVGDAISLTSTLIEKTELDDSFDAILLCKILGLDVARRVIHVKRGLQESRENLSNLKFALHQLIVEHHPVSDLGIEERETALPHVHALLEIIKKTVPKIGKKPITNEQPRRPRHAHD